MSQQFKDNFGREEEEMLEYDDSAFYYFSVAILTACLVPFTWSIIRAAIWGHIEITDQPDACN